MVCLHFDTLSATRGQQRPINYLPVMNQIWIQWLCDVVDPLKVSSCWFYSVSVLNLALLIAFNVIFLTQLCFWKWYPMAFNWIMHSLSVTRSTANTSRNHTSTTDTILMIHGLWKEALTLVMNQLSDFLESQIVFNCLFVWRQTSSEYGQSGSLSVIIYISILVNKFMNTILLPLSHSWHSRNVSSAFWLSSGCHRTSPLFSKAGLTCFATSNRSWPGCPSSFSFLSRNYLHQ